MIIDPLDIVSYILDAAIRAAVPDKTPTSSVETQEPKEATATSSVDSWAADTIDFAAMGFSSSGFSKFAMTEKKKRNTVTFTCDVCNVTLNSEANLKTHIGGAKHKRKVAKFEGKGAPERGPKAVEKASNINNVEANEDAATELPSEPAAKEDEVIAEKGGDSPGPKTNESIQTASEVTSDLTLPTEEVSDDEIVCIDDEKENRQSSSSSLTMFGLPTGFGGGKLVEAPPKKDSVKYVCDICHVELNSEATMKIHIAGQKHIKAVAKIEGIKVPHETMKKVLEKSREINEKVRQIAEQKKADREALKNANKGRIH